MSKLSKGEAIAKCKEHLAETRGCDTDDFDLDSHSRSPYESAGIWRVDFEDVPYGPYRAKVRIDAYSGKLAAEEGHNNTSENL